MPSAWKRLYLRNAAPVSSPGETELSTALPVHTFKDFAISAKSLSPSKGTTATNASGTDLNQDPPQDSFFTSFSSPPLLAATFGAGTWSWGLSCSEGSGLANSFSTFSLYVYRPSTASVVGFIYDSDTALGSEWPLSQGGRGGIFTGANVTAATGDILVLEVWKHADHAMTGTATFHQIFFDGAVDVADGDSETNSASWIESPQEIGFSPRLRRVGVM